MQAENKNKEPESVPNREGDVIEEDNVHLFVPSRRLSRGQKRLRDAISSLDDPPIASSAVGEEIAESATKKSKTTAIKPEVANFYRQLEVNFQAKSESRALNSLGELLQKEGWKLREANSPFCTPMEKYAEVSDTGTWLDYILQHAPVTAAIVAMTSANPDPTTLIFRVATIAKWSSERASFIPKMEAMKLFAHGAATAEIEHQNAILGTSQSYDSVISTLDKNRPSINRKEAVARLVRALKQQTNALDKPIMFHFFWDNINWVVNGEAISKTILVVGKQPPSPQLSSARREWPVNATHLKLLPSTADYEKVDVHLLESLLMKVVLWFDDRIDKNLQVNFETSRRKSKLGTEPIMSVFEVFSILDVDCGTIGGAAELGLMLNELAKDLEEDPQLKAASIHGAGSYHAQLALEAFNLTEATESTDLGAGMRFTSAQHATSHHVDNFNRFTATASLMHFLMCLMKILSEAFRSGPGGLGRLALALNISLPSGKWDNDEWAKHDKVWENILYGSLLALWRNRVSQKTHAEIAMMNQQDIEQEVRLIMTEDLTLTVPRPNDAARDEINQHFREVVILANRYFQLRWAIQQNNVELFLVMWKLWLPIFFTTRHHNYFREAVRIVASYEYLWSEQERWEWLHIQSVLCAGKKNGKPADQGVEHHVKTAKQNSEHGIKLTHGRDEYIERMGSNVATFEAADTWYAAMLGSRKATVKQRRVDNEKLEAVVHRLNQDGLLCPTPRKYEDYERPHSRYMDMIANGEIKCRFELGTVFKQFRERTQDFLDDATTALLSEGEEDEEGDD